MYFRIVLVAVLATAVAPFVGDDAGLAQDQGTEPAMWILQPSDLAAAAFEQQIDIAWSTANLDPNGTFEVWFRTPKGEWQIIEEREPGPGSLTWRVPEVKSPGVGRLWIGNLTNPDGETTDAKYEAVHETKLRFMADGPAPSARITNPTHGASVTSGNDVRIAWEAANLDPEGSFEVWVRLDGKDWRKLDTRAPGPGSFNWDVADVDQPTSAKVWVGNLTNPGGEGNVERYQVFDEIVVNLRPTRESADDCLSDEFEAFAESVFGEEGTLQASWQNDHHGGLDKFEEGNYEQAITHFEDYLNTLQEIQSRMERDTDGNEEPDLIDKYGVTDGIRNKLNQAIVSFGQSIAPYEDFVSLRKQAAQAFLAGNPETAESLVEQSNQAVDRHVDATDEPINTLQEVRDQLEELPCRP